MESKLILAINPGSTSTKIAVYNDIKPVFVKSIKHSFNELKSFKSVIEQKDFRQNLILTELSKEITNISEFKVVIGRGGLIKPIQSGVYIVNNQMIHDLTVGIQGEHASNLGGLIAHSISSKIKNCLALIADPVVVDELSDVARITGHPDFERKSIFHALNQKAIARSYAQSVNKKYEELKLIVAHLGGGISIGAHYCGKVVDVNQALDGEGPLSPERSGSLPVGDLVKACFTGKYEFEKLYRQIIGEGGYVAYFGTNDAYQVEMLAINGNEKAKIVQEALAYQVSKYIASLSVIFKGNVDAIILTGGIANNKYITNYITEHVGFIAPVKIFPGEDEMRALVWNALMVLNNDVKPLEYI